MDELLTRFLENLVGRVHGPMTLRLILQPLTAIIFAIRDGRKDGHEGRLPYFWALLTAHGHRRSLLRHGWRSVGKVFAFAVVLDVLYQLIEFDWFYPGEAVVTAVVLAIVPYLTLRGLVNRLTVRLSARRR